MTVTKYTKDFIDNLVDYYISEAASYRQIAESYTPEINSVTDAAFGIIAGCVYSAFLRSYETENRAVDLEDIQEFNRILKDKAPLIKKALLE